jgi:hypothetical protein
MTERLEFWKGVTVGLVAGMAAVALSRFSPTPRLAPDGRGEVLKPSSPSSEVSVRKDTLEFRLRRDEPESAGDPAILSPGRTRTSVTSFERPGGSPGGLGEVERMEVPGQAGRQIDHSDASTPVRMASRAIDLNEGSQLLFRQNWSS